MTNAELCNVLRYCGNFEDRDGCDDECPYINDKDCPKRIMCDAADALEAADRRIAELLPKEGEWIKHGCEEDEFTYWECPYCGFVGLEYHYCPNCGSVMDGKENADADS